MPPHSLKIYHITHIDNLAAIAQSGYLYSDAWMLSQGRSVHNIGMSSIKQRRLYDISVSPHPCTKVGEYVPFYWCPRSVMLYIIYRANSPDLAYKGGQGPIIHLQADFHAVLTYASQYNVKWAFSSSNAGAYYVNFYNHTSALNQIDWNAVIASDFSDPKIKEKKQAEFLFYQAFPFSLIEKIGVCTPSIQSQVLAILKPTTHPLVHIEPSWYF